MGQSGYSLVDIRDIAETAAYILKDGGHDAKTYILTGPNAVTFNDIADHLSNILGEAIHYHPVSQEMFYDSLINQGHPSWRSYDLSHISNAYKDDNKYIITTDIEDILNRPPRSIDTFLNDFKQLFKNRSL